MSRHSRLLRHAAAAAMAATLITGQATAAVQSADLTAYTLPAQDLGRALRDVAARTGRNLVMPTALVAGRRSAPLSGRYTPEAAIEALLAGSGLVVRKVGDALVIMEAGDPRAAAGQDTPVAAGADEGIVVTGTNLRGTQPTSPIVTITREDIDRSGASSTEQLMDQVPQNFSGGVGQENFAIPGVDITEHGAGVNLRGLGQRATLVLLNGRRLAPSGVGSFVDISLIPVTAIERVEILTDGASAIYGSDAVGGVVNFILRDGFDGLEGVLQAGTTTQGGGDQRLAGVTAGRAWAGGDAMLSYEYRQEEEVRAGDRDFPINLAPDRFLFPREGGDSLVGVVGQGLTDRLEVEVTGTYADRHTRRTYFSGGVPIPIGAVAEATSKGVSGSLSYDLGGAWQAVLTGNYFVADTAQQQQQPGGEGLINKLATRNALQEFGLRLDGPLLRLPGGPVRLALGVQSREEDYRDLFETQVNAPTVRADDRVIHSLFGEIYVPIVSSDNRRPGVERLVVTAAARVEDYDAYDVTVDPKLGLLWSPLDGLSLRASYDTSFRAPLLSETTGFYNAFYFPAAMLFIDPSEAPPGAALALIGSNPDIRPEQSRTWTVGGEFEPAFVPGLSLSLNYYSIRFSDRITLPTPQIVIVGDPALEALVTRDPPLDLVTGILGDAGQVLDFSGPGLTPGNAMPGDVAVIVDARFNNTAATRTRGLDIGLRYAFDLGRNRFTAEVNANRIFSFEEQLTPTSPAADNLDTPYRPVSWRARGGLSWSRGGWTGSLFADHVGDYRDNRASVAREVDSFTTIDAGLSYTFDEEAASWLADTRIALNVQNLFDVDPPRLVPDPGSLSGLGYDPVNASGRGRFVSLQLRKAW